jgi:hypothetical protein
LIRNTSLAEAIDFSGMADMTPHKIKNKGAVIGLAGKSRRNSMARSRRKIRSVSNKRQRENQVYRLIKEAVAQEYVAVLGGTKAYWMSLEYDHKDGRNATGYTFGAFLDPTNGQWITGAEHGLKTSATKKDGITQRHDFRPTEVKKRLEALKDRLVKKVGPVWDLVDLRNAVESEIYAD